MRHLWQTAWTNLNLQAESWLTVLTGDDVEVVIRKMHSGDAPPVLSRTDALNRKSWDIIEKAFNAPLGQSGMTVASYMAGMAKPTLH